GGLLWHKDIHGGLGSPPPGAAAETGYVLGGFEGTPGALRADGGRGQWPALRVGGPANPGGPVFVKWWAPPARAVHLCGWRRGRQGLRLGERGRSDSLGCHTH